MNVGFIGCGKMGSALVQGLLRSKICEAGEVAVSDPNVEAAEVLGLEAGVAVAASNRDLAQRSEVVMLCVKPGDALAAIAEAGRELEGRLLVSIVAGVPIASLQDQAGADCRVVRVMPNTAVLVQQGASAYATGVGVRDEDIDFVERVFSSVGRAFAVGEDLLNAVTGLSGSGPAYCYLVLEALADGGVRMGLPRDLAQQLAVQTMAGAAAMAAETLLHPALLREMVTSPGGTTIAGLAELERAAMRSAFMEAVRAATLRAAGVGGETE